MDKIEGISRLLGHSSTAVTDRIYNHAQIVPFASRLTKALEEILPDQMADHTQIDASGTEIQSPESEALPGFFNWWR